MRSSRPHAPVPARPRTTVRRAAGVLLIAATSLAGCGGDDGRPGTTTVTPSTTAPATTAPGTSRPTTTAPPATTTAGDEARIRAAYVTFFDGAASSVDAKVAVLENGEKYRSMLVDASANAQFQKLTANVRSVKVPNPAECAGLGVTAPCATVVFDLLVSGFPMLAEHASFAVQVGGVWKVAARAWCDVVAIGGDACPA